MRPENPRPSAGPAPREPSREEARSRAELALGAISDAVVWTDAQGRVEWCNPAFAGLVGRPHAEVVGRDLAALLPLSDDGRPLAPDAHPARAALSSPGSADRAYAYVRDGVTRFLDARSAVVRLPRHEPGVVLVLRDVTERRRTEETLRGAREETQRAFRELETFTYSVAHDLRAPLRKIDGFARILLEEHAERLGADGAGFLRRVAGAAQDMSRLIDALMTLANLSRGEPRRETVDLGRIARAAADALVQSDPSRRVRFELAAELPAEGDPDLLREVMDQLLGNAWKFTSKRAQARVSFAAERRDGRTVYVVRDDGAGFDPLYAGQLFTPLRRLHGASDFPGVGVGLAIVQRIVALHGGRVFAEGELDKGAAFGFSLWDAEGARV